MSYGGFEYTTGIGGGGFNPMGGDFGSDENGGGFLGSGSKSDSAKKANRDKQTLVPATVKMLNDGIYDGDADILRVDNIDLYSVKLIGLVESVEGHSTSTIYKINDGTGTFELKKWIDGQQTAEDKDGTFRENQMIRAIGPVKSYEGRMHMQVHHISAVDDWNELSHHLLEVIFVHLQNTKGPIPGTAAAAVPRAIANSSSSSSQWNASPMVGAIPTPSRGIQGISLNTEPNQHEVTLFEIVKRGMLSHAGGIHIDEIIRQARSRGLNYTESQFKKMLCGFTEQGTMYAGEDEDFYCTMDD